MKLVMVEADGKVCPGRVAGDRVVELSGLGTDCAAFLNPDISIALARPKEDPFRLEA